MSRDYTVGEIIEVAIEKIVAGGYGLGFAEGLTVFTSLAAVGDRLRVRLRQVKGRTAFAEIEQIIARSADRIEPPCRYFGTCGGCDLQQVNYGAQLAAKTSIIRESLRTSLSSRCSSLRRRNGRPASGVSAARRDLSVQTRGSLSVGPLMVTRPFSRLAST